MPNPVNIINKIHVLLKQAGIDIQKIIGTVDPNITKLVTKTEKTARKPKLIDALTKDKATFTDALDIFKNDARYLSQMNEMELANFANNLQDYFTVGGKVKHMPSNVVTKEGTPVVGKKLEKLSERKGVKATDDSTLQGAMEGLMSLVDDLKGITPKMRKSMDRDELVAFIRKMRGRDFTNEEIKLIREYADTYSIGLAKEKAAPAMVHAKKLGAKTKDEFEFVREYVDDIQTTSPEKFRETFDIKKVNMDINTAIENKLEKHFKKKYKWDNTKRDGGLDDATFDKYEDELYEAQKEFGDFHSVESGRSGPFGMRESTGWVNHPNNYLDEASERLQEITGEGLNVDFYKKYTDEVLTKYPKPEKFAHGGRTSTGLNYLLGEDDQNVRVPFGKGKLADVGRRLFLQAMGAGAAGIGAAKSGLLGLLKGGGKKEIVETLTQVPIKDIPGMPPWFPKLVNKVIKEGDDVTKTHSTLERQIVHKTKLPDSQTDVLVTQDLATGNVSVDIGAGKHGWADGQFGQPVRLEYKAGEWIEPTVKKGETPSKGTKTKEEFWVEEAEFTGGHPENVKFEDSTFSKFGNHQSDFSEVEAFAKGTKKKTRKISPLQKEGEDLADHFSNQLPPDDFASGGRVPLWKGSIVESGPRQKKIEEDQRIVAHWKKLEEELIKAAPEGVLMDPPPPPHRHRDKIITADRPPEEEPYSLPYYPKRQMDYIVFDDGTVYYPEVDEYYKQDGTQVTSPSPGAKPEEYSETLEMEAAEGGRVPFSKGKVVEGLAWLSNKIAPGSTKIGQTSKMMSPKTELKQAIAGFQERENIAKELESFRGQIDDNIIREISAMEPAQQLKAIEDVKLYLRNMKNLKQETTLREFDIKGQKGHASGGLAGMLGE